MFINVFIHKSNNIWIYLFLLLIFFVIFCSGGLTLRINGTYFDSANSYVLRLTNEDTRKNVDTVGVTFSF